MKSCHVLCLLQSILLILVFYTNIQAQIEVIRTFDVSANNDLVFLGSANMDSDSNEELVYRIGGGSLVVIDGNTGALEFDSRGIVSSVSAGNQNDGFSFLFCDINGDGIKEITFSGVLSGGGGLQVFVVGLQGTNGSVPKEISLSQNYPNPFNLSTTIKYEITTSGRVTIFIYDVTGRLMRTLIDQELEAGEYSADWDGKNDSGIQVSSGLYFYRMKVGAYMSAKKAILVK